MINKPEIAAELGALHEEYEEALVSNNVQRLVAFFWDSEDALRFGAGESLYGAREIEEFRKNRLAVGLARTVFNSKVVTFGDDTGIVTLEFIRQVHGAVSSRRAGGSSRHTYLLSLLPTWIWPRRWLEFLFRPATGSRFRSIWSAWRKLLNRCSIIQSTIPLSPHRYLFHDDFL